MNFPIPVNMTVSESVQQYGFSVSETDIPVDFEVATPVVANTIPDYEGPYSVTPSESVQTLETDGKAMTDDVTVGAIPSDYVGSEVPRKTSADLTASGPTVTAPAGYYSEAASKSVQRGSVRVLNTGITATPSISVDVAGKVKSTVSKVQLVSPSVTAGYVTTGTPGNISVSGHSEMQLDTEAGKTITPTESEQTAVAAQKFTTGDVKVAAIPSDYIGSSVPRKTSADIYYVENIAVAPAGYYPNESGCPMPLATYSNNITIGIEPYINVTANGLIGVSKDEVSVLHPVTSGGYAATTDTMPVGVWAHNSLQLDTQAGTTITPTEQEQTAVAAQKYTTGEVKVGAIPSNYVGSSVPTQAAQTITPTTTNQTIASGKYLTGAQTILGDANLVPESIVENITIFGVTGNAPPPVTVVNLL